MWKQFELSGFLENCFKSCDLSDVPLINIQDYFSGNFSFSKFAIETVEKGVTYVES